MARWLKLAVAAALVVTAGLAATWAARRFADDRAIAVTGTIEATQVDVSAKITARIVERTVREGQPVERGQLLVRLDAREPAAEARRAEAVVRTAEAQLRDLEAGARREEIQEAEARAARADAQLEDLLAGSRRQEIEQARAGLRNAQATREGAERDFRRARELFAKELVAAQEVDRARQAFEVAAANEVSAREYNYYPVNWREPYLARRRACGWGLYGTLGIGREDKGKMHAQHARNFAFFDAPVGLIFSIDRDLEQGSWLDYGMFLQSIMVAARSFGLETCPQAAWLIFPSGSTTNVERITPFTTLP
jgi:nitroreductase